MPRTAPNTEHLSQDVSSTAAEKTETNLAHCHEGQWGNLESKCLEQCLVQWPEANSG